MILKITFALVVAFIALIVAVRVIAQKAPRPDRMGIANGRLIPCPDKPNCVSSSEDLKPFDYNGDSEAAHRALLSILENWPRTTIVLTAENYIHVEFRSLVFSFIDDAEFYLPNDDRIIHYRSAARTGHSDLGVNSARIAEIESRFVELMKTTPARKGTEP